MSRLILSQAQQLLNEFVDYGMCPTDPRVTTAINRAIERLLPRLNPDKTIARYQFDVVQNTITMPRDVKTVLAASIAYPACTAGLGGCGPGCTSILSVKSRWYEMLPGGPVGFIPCAQNVLMDLGTGFSTFADPSSTAPLTLRLYADIPQATSEGYIVIKGEDTNGNLPFSYVNGTYINGQTLQIPVQGEPYHDTPQMWQFIGSITKPQTVGRLRLYGVDALGNQTQLAMWEPDELNPDYRRYLITWTGPELPAILTVLAKRRFMWTTLPYSDLLIANIGALELALQALKFERTGAYDQASAAWNQAFAVLDTDARDTDGDYNASVQVQEWFTGGDIWNLR
jgi:hypothetical protein